MPTKKATPKSKRLSNSPSKVRGALVSIVPVKGGITAAAGFSAGGVRAGIKVANKTDLAMVVSDAPAACAGVYTKNVIRAASIERCLALLPSRQVHAIVCNSGCANACTGMRGVKDNAGVAGAAAAALKRTPGSVMVASTGIIGQFLPMEKIKKVMPKLVTSLSPTLKGGSEFAQAIMTTDLTKKESAVRVKCGKDVFTIGGAAKGSGMINPNMGTMLCFITTDAAIDSGQLNVILRRVVNRTFNCLTVDGDMSTNDMVLVMANGESGVTVKALSGVHLKAFEDGLFEVCSDLCKKIAADGEGATKRIDICVRGAKTEDDARLAAKAVANSNLTKCAMFGNDPNWGRIACAVGYSGARFSKPKMSIDLCGMRVFEDLQPVKFNLKKMLAQLNKKIIKIDIDLGVGTKEVTAHTCDFSYDYVKINADYHT